MYYVSNIELCYILNSNNRSFKPYTFDDISYNK